MLGWEIPPFISVGLGTACYGLTKAMDRLGVNITFVLPRACAGQHAEHVSLLSTQGSIRPYSEFKNVRFRAVASPLRPYSPSGTSQAHAGTHQAWTKAGTAWGWQWAQNPAHYGGNMLEDVTRYADTVARIAQFESFDVIHAHDWMTYPAGMLVAKQTGRPLIVHVHSTEFDRSGEHVNQPIYDIERAGMHAADKVIAVSNYTKNILISRYAVNPDKVEVVYNGVDSMDEKYEQMLPAKDDRIVLFLGRITMQKGPEYFLAAAKKVLEKIDNVRFVMAGEGDMLHRIIELAAQIGIGSKVVFTRFLRGPDVDAIFRMADLYVMPSVSEPFGIAPLEAMQRDVPVLISRQSGVAEVLNHVLKVDFWDINQMANKIIAVLRYAPLRAALRQNGRFEVRRFRWEDAAAKIVRLYEQMVPCPA